MGVHVCVVVLVLHGFVCDSAQSAELPQHIHCIHVAQSVECQPSVQSAGPPEAPQFLAGRVMCDMQ